MAEQLWQLFVEPVMDIWRSFVETVPSLVAALIFLLIGLTLARVLSAIVEKTLEKINLDNYTSKVGINEILARVGFGKSATHVLVFIIYWSIILVFVTIAANVLNLYAVSVMLEKFMLFVPKLVAAVALVFGGLLFARFSYDVISNSAKANNLRGGVALAKVVQGVIVIVATLTALQQIGMDTALLNSIMIIFTASIGLAFALAFGLGARDMASKALENMADKQDK